MVSFNENASDERSRGVERRTILKAAAWTVPTVLVATASPAAATASGTMAAVSASADQNGASRNVKFTVTFAGTSPGNHIVTFTHLSSPGIVWLALNIIKTIPSGGGTVEFQGTAALGSNPAGRTVTISYLVAGHGTGTIAASIPGTASLQKSSATQDAEQTGPSAEPTTPKPEPTTGGEPDQDASTTTPTS
jgi:hypothetical protein